MPWLCHVTNKAIQNKAWPISKSWSIKSIDFSSHSYKSRTMFWGEAVSYDWPFNTLKWPAYYDKKMRNKTRKLAKTCKSCKVKAIVLVLDDKGQVFVSQWQTRIRLCRENRSDWEHRGFFYGSHQMFLSEWRYYADGVAKQEKA